LTWIFDVDIQVNFEDSYRNLTLKAMSALAWIGKYCNRTRYVLKTDDDAYVNMRALLKHLGTMSSDQSLNLKMHCVTRKHVKLC